MLWVWSELLTRLKNKMAEADLQKQLYECVKLLEVEESTPVAGGETPFNSIGELNCAYSHCLYAKGVAVSDYYHRSYVVYI